MTTSPSDVSFASLGLPQAQLANLQSLHYNEMTAIQAQSLPSILAGRDVIAQAKTGSGKTAAFGLGILFHLNPTFFALQSLVLCPTRELADQVAKSLRQLARHMNNIKILSLCGGSPMGPQIASLQHGAHIVVGTPGRLLDHIERGSIDLRRVKMLVLDEADRMIDMGFYEDVAHIVAHCPKHRQTLLFSATYSDEVLSQSADFLRDPVQIEAEAVHQPSHIEQRFYEVEHPRRNAAAAQLITHFRPESTLAFCNTKVHCHELATQLREQGIDAQALYGDMEQRDRDRILAQFANRSCSVLVATDVAARGLDIHALDLVLNVDVSRDADVHTHRIGRTGRGAQQGLAVTLCAPGEKKWVKQIQDAHPQNHVQWFSLEEAKSTSDEPLLAPMKTLCISAGRKDKLRPGDILGALTAAGLTREQVGKINVFDFFTYVAIDRHHAESICQWFEENTLKGKRFKVRLEV